MAKDLDYPIVFKKCEHCGDGIDVYSNAQKYCQRDDNPECCDDRHFSKLWENGKHPLLKDLERHDYACCDIDEIFHITISATETLCGKKWKYTPNQENFKRKQAIQRLHFLAPKEITCNECIIIAKQKEALGEKF